MRTAIYFAFIFGFSFSCYQASGQCGSPPTGNSPSSCNGASINMSATSLSIADGTTVRHHWYYAQTGGTSFTITTASHPYVGSSAYVSTYTTGFSSTTTYWVSTSCNYGAESSTRSPVTFTLISPGSITIGVSVPPTLCAGDPITLTPQNCSGCSWTAGTSGTGAKTVSPATTTMYTVSGQELTCNTSTSASITVNVSVKAGQVSAPSGTTAFCQGTVSSSNYSASATNASSYQWGLSPGGAGSINSSGSVTWNSGFSGTATVSITAFSATYCSYTTSNSTQVTVHPTPSQPTVSNQTITCGQIVSASGAGANETYKWYTWNGSSYVYQFQATASPALSSTITYYVSKYNTVTGCESSKAGMTATVNPLATPSVTSPVSLQYNTSTNLSASGAGSGETYKWYNSGDSFLGTGTTWGTGAVNGASSYTYYVTKYNSTTGCETPYANKATIVVNLFVPDPVQAVASVNTCYDKILTLNTSPDNVTWYLQTTSNSTSTATPLGTQYTLTTTGTYYIRAHSNTINLWSNSIQLSVPASTVNPVDITLNSYDAANADVRATYRIKLAPGFTVTSGQTFGAKIEVTPECNQRMNWTETIMYDKDQNIVRDSRTYLDGNGAPIQSTVKDLSNGKVLVSQPLFNYLNTAVGSTLSAPILEREFIYKNEFASDASGNRYSYDDFDLRTTTNVAGSGEVNYPKAMGTQAGTVGWYYSSGNDIEPQTPTTQYPYSRQFTAEGPDPVASAAAGPGDAFRMGSTHEGKSARSLIVAGELDHYYGIRPLFVSTPPPGSNLLTVTTLTTTGFSGSGASVSSSNGYIDVLATSTGGTPGVTIGGPISVTAGKKYVLSVRGYVPTGEPQPYLFAKVNGGADVTWPGSALPVTNEDWVSIIFTVPAGATQVNVGVRYNGNQVNGTSDFLIGAVQLKQATPALAGYKYIGTDPNGKLSVSFADADGRNIASAVITGGSAPTYTYDYWSYTLYNDAGAVVATVAPKDINTGLFTIPIASINKYDHLGRLIETASPDEGTSKFVYSTDGKIRFSQNQIQYSANKFSYTNYDRLGRLIESGEYTTTGTNPYVFEPHSTTSPASYSVLGIVDNTGFTGVSRQVDNVRCSEHDYVTYDVAGGSAPVTQRYLYGQVSKTENANASTWYSYDDLGQLEWTIQAIAGLGNKRIDYTYDFFGNVTRVAYQNGVPGDRFYHHYEYDVNGRMTNARTSFDGVSDTTLQATYYYYTHGPLKRVELAGDLQGIDYVYTIDGALKSINHSDPAKDPGGDGILNAFPADVFGQTLNYYANDYSGASYSAGNITASGISDQYNGLVKYNSWFSVVDNPTSKKIYGYTYDALNQLQNAQFSPLTGTAGSYSATFPSDGAYREAITGYDKNGNITGLRRNNKTTNMANYAYSYNSGKNSLDYVSGGADTIDLSHNVIGQMIEQTEGSNTMKVFYNAYGLVKEVQNASNQPVVKYYYDDRGNRVKREDYGGGTLSRTTFYVSDARGNVHAIYDNASSSFVKKEVPIYAAGRVGVYKPVPDAWFYELSDNLGNVRAVIGPPKTTTFTATMESENSTAEDLRFKNIAPRSSFVRPTVTPPALAGNEGVVLNNTRITGPAFAVKVAPGDVITAEVYAYYEGCSNCATTQTVAAVVNSVAAAFGGVSGQPGEAGKIYNAINGVMTGGFGGAAGSGDNAVPAAYLNMITFNNNLDVPDPLVLPMSAVMITSAANMQKQKLTIGPITIPSPGYVYIYINNNSNSSTNVYFDDMTISHTQSPYVAGADYYPFGLTMSDREILEEPYRSGYQGQFSEEDSVTGWNNFELRMYDPRIGRWISPDPYGQFASPYVGMGNNPVSGTDPDGGFCEECLAKFLADGGKFLDEVVVTASRGAEVVGSVGLQLLSGLGRTATQLSYHVNGLNHTLSGGIVPLMKPMNQNTTDAQQFGAEISAPAITVAMTMTSGTATTPMPGGRPVLATSNGNIPVTTPVVAPTVKATNVHGQVFAKKATPDTNPGDFTKLKGDQGYIHKKTGEIYRKSYTSHGNQGNTGKQWKVYPKGTTDFSKQTGLRTTIDGEGNIIGN
ncbi:MAG TPA: RHS repeat-associated core domain-containing protein [Cyclobacteriaceae bacterium]|nr:RHS repeat-associated core domain-containing protein [Cyclobacteriaceae bacterium]